MFQQRTKKDRSASPIAHGGRLTVKIEVHAIVDKIDYWGRRSSALGFSRRKMSGLVEWDIGDDFTASQHIDFTSRRKLVDIGQHDHVVVCHVELLQTLEHTNIP